MPTETIYHVPVTQADGEPTTLSPYQGKVLLVVNVASRCGFTPQYKTLEALHRKYETQGFSVLGFPCNQFGGQEPGTNAEIKAFASSCFRITFPLFAKIDVKGPSQCPLYRYLQTHLEKKAWIFIPWNFTKILVDGKGHVVRRFLPFTSMKTVERAIEKALKETTVEPA